MIIKHDARTNHGGFRHQKVSKTSNGHETSKVSNLKARLSAYTRQKGDKTRTFWGIWAKKLVKLKQTRNLKRFKYESVTNCGFLMKKTRKKTLNTNKPENTNVSEHTREKADKTQAESKTQGFQLWNNNCPLRPDKPVITIYLYNKGGVYMTKKCNKK